VPRVATPIDIIGSPRSVPAAMTQVELDAFEQRLGVVLPRSVREVYGRVGNGGFGPGYGRDVSPNGAGKLGER
jgi:hypothetical protein